MCELHIAGLHPHRHRETDDATRGSQPAERTQSNQQRIGGSRRTQQMSVTGEQQEHCIPAELQQVTVERVGDSSECLEDIVEDIRELFSSDFSASREAL